MALIYETRHYTVESADAPLVTRLDGGHIIINPRTRVEDRTKLTPPQAIELMRLTMLTGSAMTEGLRRRGIPIGRINYQDNGNWGIFTPEGPCLHIHLYGRATGARFHKYGEACNFPPRLSGFYDDFESLDEDDRNEIRTQIVTLTSRPEYLLRNWGLQPADGGPSL